MRLKITKSSVACDDAGVTLRKEHIYERPDWNSAEHRPENPVSPVPRKDTDETE